MKIFYCFLFFVSLFPFSHHLDGQTVKNQYGPLGYIIKFNEDAVKLHLDDLRTSKDSLNIRIWIPGKLVDFSVRNDTFFGQKIFFIHKNPSRKQRKPWTTIYDKINIENEQMMILQPMVDTIIKSFTGIRDYSAYPFFRNTTVQVKNDSISKSKMKKKDGFFIEAIEFADKDSYVWTPWGPSPNLDGMIERMIDNLELEKYDKMNLSKMPRGYLYSYDKIGKIYKLTFIDLLFYRLGFRRRY